MNGIVENHFVARAANIRRGAIANPYEPPASEQLSASLADAIPARRHVLRNMSSWTLCLIAYCIVDVFYVKFGRNSFRLAELMLVPGFLSAMLYANRGLFPSIADSVTRWLCVIVVSGIVALFSGFVLISLGVWFHFSFGGSL